MPAAREMILLKTDGRGTHCYNREHLGRNFLEVDTRYCLGVFLSECSERDSSPDRPHSPAPSSFCRALAYMATPSRYTWYRVSFVRLPFQFDDRTNLVEANSNRLFICVRKKSCPSEDASQSSLSVTKPRSKMRKAGEKSWEVDGPRKPSNWKPRSRAFRTELTHTALLRLARYMS